MTSNGSAIVRYATIISVQKPAGLLRIQTRIRKILKRILKRQPK